MNNSLFFTLWYLFYRLVVIFSMAWKTKIHDLIHCFLEETVRKKLVQKKEEKDVIKIKSYLSFQMMPWSLLTPITWTSIWRVLSLISWPLCTSAGPKSRNQINKSGIGFREILSLWQWCSSKKVNPALTPEMNSSHLYESTRDIYFSLYVMNIDRMNAKKRSSDVLPIRGGLLLRRFLYTAKSKNSSKLMDSSSPSLSE